MNSWDQTATSPAPTDPQHNIDVTSTSAGLGEIVAALQRSSNTSAGIGGIPMALLKPHMPQLPDGDCSNSDAEEPPGAAAAITTIASMLQRLYSKVAGTGVVPLQWQSAVLTPIYKQKGDVNDLGNYRPLSVPTVTCRLWSTITNHRLMQEIGDILPDSMFGFRPDRSCIDPLILLCHLHDAKRANASKIFAAALMNLSGAYAYIHYCAVLVA